MSYIIGVPTIAIISVAAFTTSLTAWIWVTFLAVLFVGILSVIQRHRHFEFDDKKFDPASHNRTLDKYVRQVKHENVEANDVEA